MLKFLLLVLPLLAPGGKGQDFKEAQAQLLAAIDTCNEEKAAEAIAKIAENEGDKAVEILTKSILLCVSKVPELEEKKKEAEEKRAKSAYDPVKKKWKGMWVDWNAANKTVLSLTDRINGLQGIRIHIVRTMRGMKSEEAGEEIIKQLKGNRDGYVRSCMAEALGGIAHEEALPVLFERLKKDKDTRVRVAAIKAIGYKRPTDDESVERLCGCLDDAHWQVVVEAGRALGHIKSPKAVEPLLEALEKAEGRVQSDLNTALAGVTGVNKHGNLNAWKDWWKRNRDEVLAGTYKPPSGEAKGGGAATTFYGIPVLSNRVVFVIDRSGSMEAPSKWTPPEGIATGKGKNGDAHLKPKGTRKIDIAGYELKKVLTMLPERTFFNIVFYDATVEAFKENMAPLTAQMRSEAFQFIDRMAPYGATNISEAMKKGMSFAGDSAVQKLGKSGVDTIYLLSDGMPTVGITTSDKLREALRELNRVHRITIHTIAIEPSKTSEKLMKEVAAESGGQYAKR